MAIVYAVVTDDCSPENSEGTLLSVHSSRYYARLELDSLFATDVMAFAEGCEFEEGEDYEKSEDQFSSNFEQWWWIRPMEVLS